jgi:hypothetical protein
MIWIFLIKREFLNCSINGLKRSNLGCKKCFNRSWAFRVRITNNQREIVFINIPWKNSQKRWLTPWLKLSSIAGSRLTHRPIKWSTRWVQFNPIQCTVPNSSSRFTIWCIAIPRMRIAVHWRTPRSPQKTPRPCLDGVINSAQFSKWPVPLTHWSHRYPRTRLQWAPSHASSATIIDILCESLLVVIERGRMLPNVVLHGQRANSQVSWLRMLRYSWCKK